MGGKLRFTEDFKAMVLAEVDECGTNWHWVHAVIVRHGVTTNDLYQWRLQLSSAPRIARQRTLAEKRQILDEWQKCQDPAERIAILRREGINHSFIQAWSKAERRKNNPGLDFSDDDGNGNAVTRLTGATG